jgi:cytochrome c-type protein NapB
MAAPSTNSLLRIGIATALIAAFVYVVAERLHDANAPATLPLSGDGGTPSIPSETGVFRLSELGREYLGTPDTPPGSRSLATFRARRAYPGAPPIVPHPLADQTSYGGRTCLACHGDGGWVQKFGAYAPVTPHPELVSCLQCHVPSADDAPFRGSSFRASTPPALGGAALPGSPPPIPHDLAMRSNCLACHAGPAAVREVRTTHPDRVNCRQCHVPAATPARPFDRGGARRP